MLALVASYGRSGSSRLLELLDLTGSAAVAGGFPYERRLAQFDVLCRSGAGALGPDGALTFDAVRYPPPSRRRPDESEVVFRLRMMSENGGFTAYREADGTVVNDVIAEKAIGLAIVRQVLGHRPQAFAVVLDRDPRDVFLSVLAFNHRRGFVDFGAENGPAGLAANIAGYYREAAELVSEHPGRLRVLTYEELVTHPLSAVRRALPAPLQVGDATSAALALITHPGHVTAPDVAGSVGRWRSAVADWPVEFALLDQARTDFRALVPAVTGTGPA